MSEKEEEVKPVVSPGMAFEDVVFEQTDIGAREHTMDVRENKNPSLFDLAKLKDLGGYKAGDLLAVDPELYRKFMQHLSKTVKRDRVAKSMVFLTGLSAFTREPINLFLRGESSIGKTYNSVQTLKYFPQDNVWFLGGLSPKALIHERGKLVDKNGEEIDLAGKPERPRKTDYGDNRDFLDAVKDYKEKVEVWKKRLKDSKYVIELKGKILMFLEAPHFETFNMLRPILSHDKFEISYRFVDRTAKGQLKTRHVIIRGWPACIFCSTREKYVQDLATRSFTVTPETTQEKYRDANLLTGEKAAFPWKFQNDSDFMLLEAYVRFLKNNLETVNVVVPYGKEFGKQFPTKFSRSMRDFKHVLNLMKVSALFHFAQRPILVQKVEDKEHHYIIAIAQDYDFVMSLWNQIRETTETSAPGQIVTFFHEVVEKITEEQAEFLIQDLVEEWNSQFEDKKSSSAVRKWVDFLCDIGYMTKKPNPNDKRSNVLTVIKEKNSESVGFNLAEFFDLDSFKEWSNGVNQILEKSTALLKENLVSHNETSVVNIFKKYFLGTNSKISNISLSRSMASLDERTEEKTHFQKATQFPNSKPTIQEVLERMCGTFREGTEEEWLTLVMESGLSQAEAERLFESLKGEELFWFDEGDKTLWRWGWMDKNSQKAEKERGVGEN